MLRHAVPRRAMQVVAPEAVATAQRAVDRRIAALASRTPSLQGVTGGEVRSRS